MKKLRLERRTIAQIGMGSLRNAVGGVNESGGGPAANSMKDPRTIMIPCGKSGAECDPTTSNATISVDPGT
jgi:hypothetical protein